MCGISGFINREGIRADAALAEAMATTLVHRGPDGIGVHIEGNVALAHARLSIIDLAGGGQPMQIDGGRLSITFNGEIFNYLELREELIKNGRRFATRSDTEVILHLYDEHGPDCVHYLNGQWAFAIWDRQRQHLFLSRDRMGVRPLYYTFTDRGFVFASEVKAMFADPEVAREIDVEALDQIFTFWCPLPSRSFFKGVRQLPPGHSAILKDGTLELRRYWKLEYEPDDHYASPKVTERATEELLNLLLDATRIRLRADVPVGAYLSGGIDSTLTTALIARIAGHRLRTFSIAFEDAEYDESSYQLEASAFLGTQHSQIRCSYDDIARVFPDVLWHAEQPVLRTAPAPLCLLSKLVRDSGFKVVVTGEGSDEIFGGYDIYKEAKIRQFWGKDLESRLRPLLLKRLYPYMKNIQSQSPEYLKRFFHVGPAELASPFFSHLPRWTVTSRLKSFFTDELAFSLKGYDATSELEAELPAGFAQWNSFIQAQYLETAYLLPGYILSSQGDRVAMANSVEGRYPFLDYRVVQFAAKLPIAMKMKVLNEKYLLKKVSEGLIPPSIIQRHKQPYRAPDGKSFFSAAADGMVEQMLSPEVTSTMGLFKPAAVSRLVQKFRSGSAIGAKDNMALVGILSTAISVDKFINRFTGRQQPCKQSHKSYAISS